MQTLKGETSLAKILALDVGEKRIGLATTDELEIIVSGFGFIEREHAVEKVAEIVENEAIEGIVVGLPMLPSGEKGSQAEDVEKFVSELADKINVDIEFENEVLSSVEAENRLKSIGKKIKDKGEIDEMAAIVILESYQRRRGK